MNSSIPTSTSLLKLLVEGSRAMESHLAERLTQPDGWTPTAAQLSLLRHLDAHESATVTELASAIGITSQSMGEQVRRLESRNVLVVGGGGDRRARCVSLSARGRRLLCDARTEIDSLETLFGTRVGVGDIDRVRRVLAAIPSIIGDID